MGGNVFQGTKPFDHSKIDAMMKQVNSVLSKTGAKALPIGSGATPTPGKMSGDLDMIVDANFLAQKFNVKKPVEIKKALQSMYDQAGFETAITGQSVHVKTTVDGEAQQVDIMIVPNAEQAAKLHTHNIPKGSPYKGVHKHIALSWLAKQKGYSWSPYKGILDKTTKELVTNDPDEIAKLLIGPNASANDISSLEAIAKAQPDGGKAMLGDLEQDSNFVDKKVESPELTRIKQLSGV